MAKTIEQLMGERAKLTQALSWCERGAFPGSKAWQAEKRAMDALAAFDAAHPEVLPEIERRHCERSIGGKDVGGI